MNASPLLLSIAAALALGCKSESPPAADDAAPPAPTATPTGAATGPMGPSEAPTGAGEASEPNDRAHTVVFGDRTSHAYLLLLRPASMPVAPTREALDREVVAAFGERAESGELAALRKLIATEPHDTDRKVGEMVELENGELVPTPNGRPDDELLGLHVELLPRGPELIAPAALRDPVATRHLNDAERDSLEARSVVLLVRADYRNQNDVRGLRLLQQLVELLAREHDALIFDPDTLETLDLEAFAQRRLSANANNLADQIVILPFPDPDHEGRARLVTRGMRRFGVPDLELEGLRPDPKIMQGGSDLLAGLATVLVDAAEVDPSGLAVQADDVIEITRRDIDRAYANQSARLPPRCASCPERVQLHLMRRPPRPTDADDHLTVRVVAPRAQFEAPEHDTAAWAESTLRAMFDLPAPPTPSPPTPAP